jgi:hypothetical protein
MMRSFLVMGALAGATLAASRVLAGWAPTQLVAITDQPLIGGHAEGKVGDVYNSDDTTQFIGCGLRADVGSPLQVNCWAADASGRQRACASTDPSMITVAGSVGTDSYVYFAWNLSGKCTQLDSTNGSFSHPKK